MRMLRRIEIVILAFFLLFLSGCLPQKEGEQEEASGVRVTFFDVGKGDAILVETAHHAVLIDSGYDDTREIILDYMEKQEISVLDYLVITHFDKDHVGGADWILRGVETQSVLQPDYESDSAQYREYVEAVKEKGVPVVPVTKTMEVSLDGVDFLVYPPQEKSYEEEDNDFSLVIRMTCGKKSFLFAADCERERLGELLEQEEFPLSHDVLKVPHHGRKEKNSRKFLEAVRPGAAVITSSKEKPADDEICRMLEELGTEVYFTQNGTVTCLCDGKEIRMVQE